MEAKSADQPHRALGYGRGDGSLLVFGLFLVRPLLLVLRVPRAVFLPIIFLLCTVEAYANAERLFDIYVMLAVGIGAFFLRRRDCHMAPFVLGLVLGGLLDKSLRRGLVLSGGCRRCSAGGH